MARRPLFLLATITLAFVLAGSAPRLAGTAAELPARLSDAEFWRLSEELSEPNGSFQSDNLMSNEMVFARLVPDLIAKTKPGGVYLGVGPEQNFTYIAAMKPGMVFITDIRRGNLHLQLMYKAIFELSANRSEFVARLFTRPRASNVTAASSVVELMTAYWDLFPLGESAYAANLKAIQDHLTKTRLLPLPAEDLEGIARVYRAFYWYGPSINYSANVSLSLGSAGRPGTYFDLMTQLDPNGQGLGYLATEEKFGVLKDLEHKNLVVPVVGNFSGPKALRAVGAYVRARGATVSAFYVSNVESYLRRDGSWPAFCANVASMPLDDGSLFIRPSGGGTMVTRGAPPAATSGATGGGTGTVTAPVLVSGTFYFISASGGTSGSGLVPIAAEVKAACGGSGGGLSR